MSIKDKMKNAKESHLFDELSEKEKFEAILEGRLKVRLISELEKIKIEIKDLDLGFFDEDYRAGIARGIMEFNKILNKHIKELKGENNEDSN